MKRSLCAAVLVLGAIVVGCGGDDSSSSETGGTSGGDVPTIKIGRLVPQTGPYVEFAKIQAQAFDLAVEQVNAKGKVKLEVVDADQGGTPPEAVAGYERVKREDPDVIVSNGGSSSQAVAVAAAAAGDGLLQFAANADPLKANNPNGFNTLPHNSVQLPLATEAFWDEFGSEVKTAAYIAPNDYDLGKESVKYRREFFEGKGVKTVIDEQIPGTSRDLTSVAGKVAAAKPDLVVSDLAANIAVWAQQLKDTGYVGKSFSGAALASTAVTRLAPEAYEGYYTFQNWNPAATDLTATAKQFIEDFKAKYDVEPDGYAAAQYDGVLTLAAAAEATGSNDPQELADWLRSNNGPEGVTMTALKYTAEQGLASPVYLTRVLATGEQEPIAVKAQASS